MPAEQGSGHHWKFFMGHYQSAICTWFHILYVYDYITKFCRKQAEVIQDEGNENVCNIGQSEACHRKNKRLKLGSSHLYNHSSV
jgi:hypothetical protein